MRASTPQRNGSTMSSEPEAVRGYLSIVLHSGEVFDTAIDEAPLARWQEYGEVIVSGTKLAIREPLPDGTEFFVNPQNIKYVRFIEVSG